jgi:inositol oxygenase
MDNNPLVSLDDWDDDVLARYPEPSLHGQLSAGPPARGTDDDQGFRNYAPGTRDGVREFYRVHHARQTVDFNRAVREKYVPLQMARMSIWQAIERLEELFDDSDPDTELPQLVHAVQTAEAIRRDGHPDWFILTGLIHDLGKVLCLFGEPQWAVVGDTFPVGCAFSDRIVLTEFLQANPDLQVPEYQTEVGIYSPACGLDHLLLTWGHDEYLHHVVRSYLPEPALAMIRYHSCYPIHRERAYQHLLSGQDHEHLAWVRQFNRYDLYTKSDAPPDLPQLLPYYERLVDRYFPTELAW